MSLRRRLETSTHLGFPASPNKDRRSNYAKRTPSRSPRGRLSVKRLSMSPLQSRNSTIVLESSGELEFIDTSIPDVQSEFDWIRTPRTSRLRKNGITHHSLSSPMLMTDKNGRQSWICSLATPNSGSEQKSFYNSNEPLKSPLCNESLKIEDQLKENVLVGSRLRNVEAWLTSTQKEIQTRASKLKTSPRDRSPMDPKVQAILKSIYGNDWFNDEEKTCKTEVKNEKLKNTKAFATEVKEKPSKKTKSPKIKPVRRKIFDDTPQQKARKTSPTGPISSRKTPKRRLSIEKLSPTPSVSRKIETPLTVKSGKTPATVTKSRKKVSLKSSDVKATPKRTFLSSLAPTTPTAVCHPEARDYKVNFKKKKEELCTRLFKLYNSEVFNNALPDDLEISWNPRMRGTAGFCYCKRRRDRLGVISFKARIALSSKIIDRADRLRDTLIHELCHAAAWLINGALDNHGPIWTNWTIKARERFPELPPIQRCHNYDIVSKFVYKCSKCGYCIKRHSKSLDTVRKRCGICFGTFQLFTNKKVSGKDENPKFDITQTLRAPNAFAMFVKDNYRLVKETHPDKKHIEIMKNLSEQYAVYKSVTNPKK